MGRLDTLSKVHVVGIGSDHKARKTMIKEGRMCFESFICSLDYRTYSIQCGKLSHSLFRDQTTSGPSFKLYLPIFQVNKSKSIKPQIHALKEHGKNIPTFKRLKTFIDPENASQRPFKLI